ncbi:MAG TPA: hypothetical protein VK897_02725 [Anaerolineales bacterium]|nr:hypothetical protein [Anaerolineales bacterium]
MNLGAIVEVTIGLIFVWIVLSLTIIQIQEWINTRLDKRAKDMEEAIHEMLANPNLKAQLYDHPVIRGLTSKKRNEPSPVASWFYRYPILRGFTKEIRKLPSYIPSQQFSLALFDIVITAGTESSLIQQGLLKIRDDLEKDRKITRQEAVIVELNLLIELARSAAATEAGTAFTRRTLALLKKRVEEFALKYPHLKPVIEAALQEASQRKDDIDDLLKGKDAPRGRDAFADLQRGIAALSVISPEVNQTLNALLLNLEEYIGERESKLARARQNVEKWFDDSMDRVSGVFKRYSQWMALVIGFVIALMLNVDSIDLTLYLLREPTVRQVLAQNASSFQLPEEEMENNPEEALRDFRQQFTGLSLPIGWGINRSSQGTAFLDDDCRLFPGTDQTFGVPVIGTPFCLVPPQSSNQNNLAVKLAGIFITALAARQGAPFWFDVLKRVVNLRGTGANPAEKEGK